MLTLLGNRIVVILGNLTYPVYLIHVIVIHYYIANSYETIKLDYSTTLWFSFKVGCIALVLAFFVHLLVEKSFINIENRFVFNKQKKLLDK